MPSGTPPGGLELTGTKLSPTKTLVEYAAEWLRESILSGAIPPGDRVRLDGIAQELGMSQIPVREALRTLATEGLVIPLAHRGYTVQAMTIEDLDDTYRLRLMLEPRAVELAVPRLENDKLRVAEQHLRLLERATQSSDWPSHRVHHRAFHFTIYDECDSPWLLRFADMLWLNSERYQRITGRIKGELRERMNEHRAILAACQEGSAKEASRLMHGHLSNALEKLREYLREHETGNAKRAKADGKTTSQTRRK